jgi:hypothetical protein
MIPQVPAIVIFKGGCMAAGLFGIGLILLARWLLRRNCG